MPVFRPSNPLGILRSRSAGGEPMNCLPQQADRLDVSLPLHDDELLIDVKSLNIDSASFHQISQACGGDLKKIEAHILDLVSTRGKHHNPVTGSGGMLMGRIAAFGPAWPQKQKPVQIGESIATLVSLTLTPLTIKKIHKTSVSQDRVDIEGQAILFASGVFSKLPTDLPEGVSLAALDVCGAPAQVQRLVKPGNKVVVIGGGGKSGLLCLAQAKKIEGVQTIAVDYSQTAVDRLSELSFVDEVIQTDARNAAQVMDRIWHVTKGRMADVVINVANIPDTEMASILSARARGVVYFFSMATQFTRAALGAESVGYDVDLMIGNGYCEGHADLALQLIRENEELKQIFLKEYSGA